jgi:hypothetical protein
MKTRMLFWLLLFGFVIESVWLFYGISKDRDEVERTVKLQALQDRADVTLRTLERLKNNDTNIVVFLENQLNIAVISLGGVLKTIPESQWDVSSLRILGETRNYYGKFPPAQLDPGIVQAFSFLGQATNSPSP